MKRLPHLHHTLNSWRASFWRTNALAFVLWVGCIWPLSAAAQFAAPDARAQLVAQTVMGIVSYTRWTEELSTVHLCIFGPTQYADEILKGGRLASGRTVQARRVFLDDPKMLDECHGVYVGVVSDEEWRRLFASMNGRPLLTISERKALCSIGCMFCVDVLEGEVGFEVNLDSLARSGVNVNPRVLQLGRRKAAP
ncbi:MAG: YfiR family protein [Giesbergeria sp.]